MPVGKLVCYGVWEAGSFRGAVIFGRGATPTYGVRFGLAKTAICELVRVALRTHSVPTSRVVARCLKLLRSEHSSMACVMSFSDVAQGHLGVLYQACNFAYLGMTDSAPQYFYQGRWVHPRSVTGVQFGRPCAATSILKTLPKKMTVPKHRYAFGLTRVMKKRLRGLHQPYPRAVEAKNSVAPGDQPGEAGADPADRSSSTE